MRGRKTSINYVARRRGRGGRGLAKCLCYYISLCSKLAYGGGSKIAKSCLRSLWMPPMYIFTLQIQGFFFYSQYKSGFRNRRSFSDCIFDFYLHSDLALLALKLFVFALFGQILLGHSS